MFCVGLCLMSVWYDASLRLIWSYWPSLTPVLSSSPSCPHTVIRSPVEINLFRELTPERETPANRLVSMSLCWSRECSLLTLRAILVSRVKYWSDLTWRWRGSPTIQGILIWNPSSSRKILLLDSVSMYDCTNDSPAGYFLRWAYW